MDKIPNPESVPNSEAIVCSVCGGDPRASVKCKVCGGAGIGVASSDGFLVWTEKVDDFSVAFRKIKRGVTTGFHAVILVFIILTFVVFVWRVSALDSIGVVGTFNFWIVGHWYVTLLCFGLFCGCFFIFRLFEYSKVEKVIPTWHLTESQLEARDSKVAKSEHRFDVSPYYSEQARDVVESAYKITKDLKRTQVDPHMLFSAVLTSPTGGLFMARLGMDFNKIKEPLARFMVAESAAGNPPVTLSRETKRILALAYAEARSHRRQYVSPMELFIQSFSVSLKLQELIDKLGFPAEHVRQVAEWVRLQEKLREDYHRFVKLAALKPKTAMNRAMTAQQTPLLDRFSEDLTMAARDGRLAPLVGRKSEMDSLLRAIESGQGSAVLVGSNGVGKSAIVEELARRMVAEDVPVELFDRRLVSVNLAQLIASGDPSLAAERLLTILNEIAISGNVILAARGIEALVGGSGAGPLDLAETFASEMDKGYFITVASTTSKAWTEYLENRSLGSKLVKVDVLPLGADDTLRVLMAKSGVIEYRNKVFFTYQALDKATSLALRYMYDVSVPESALNVLREAAVVARKARGEKTFVTAEDVAGVVHEKTGIPVEAVTQSETEKLLEMETHLHERIIGQQEAVAAVSQALRRARAELREGKRPIANFMFLGPTGVGKTELTKALAAEYFGEEKAMVRVDMSEYQDPTSVARMIGVPGDQRGGLLTEAVRKAPFSIVLLDEVEKAHPDILNLFLQVMEDGRLTDGVGRTVDFTNAIVIMTSNAGTPFIQAEVNRNTPLENIKTALLERELKGIFRPEFLNRFDGIIVFKPLTLDEVSQIAWLQINKIEQRLLEKGIKFRAEDKAMEDLARAGFDPQFGARPLRRVIQDRIENQLADILLRHQVERGDTIVLREDGSLSVEK
ncbi:MAG: ATP-dependent Clp protease ATP-binding subunit [Patescibacteria group bacterium]